MNFGSVLNSLMELSRIPIEGSPLEKLIFGNTQSTERVTKADSSSSVEMTPTVDNGQLFPSTVELIEKNGYPAETHLVTTDDGYILSLHRIPHGKNGTDPPETKRPVVLLQQGVLSSSAVWVLSSVDKCLAFRLVDQGYDVWIGNSRGTTYSKGHVSLDIKSEEYWDFSWHEMGMWDLKSYFDYILSLTGQPDLHYVGHSMGTTLFFAGLALRPEYNSKVRLMTAMAPVAYTKNIVSPVSLLAPYIVQLEWLSQFLGINELLPNSPLSNFLGATIGHDLSPLQRIYPNIFYYLCGEDSGQMDKKVLPVLVGHMPAGISVKSLTHFGQGINTGGFCQYNYGRRINNAVYGRPTPPDYDLSKITCPVAIYHSDNDLLSTKPDVQRLAEALPNVVNKFLVPHEKFNHMDFLFTSDSTLLYKKMEETMKSFDAKK